MEKRCARLDDAGSSLIVVFDGEGEYVMQWGGRGSGPGEFDFGSGINLFKGREYECNHHRR